MGLQRVGHDWVTFTFIDIHTQTYTDIHTYTHVHKYRRTHTYTHIWSTAPLVLTLQTLQRKWKSLSWLKMHVFKRGFESESRVTVRGFFLALTYNLSWHLMVCADLCAQSCLTLCHPMDCSPPGSSDHGIPQARILSGLLFPPPGDLPNPEIEPMSLTSPALADTLFTTEPPGRLTSNGNGPLSREKRYFIHRSFSRSQGIHSPFTWKPQGKDPSQRVAFYWCLETLPFPHPPTRCPSTCPPLKLLVDSLTLA